MAGVSGISGNSLKFLLENNVRLNGLTTLIKGFNTLKNTTAKIKPMVSNKKGIILNNQTTQNRKGIYSLFSNAKGNFKGSFVDILA